VNRKEEGTLACVRSCCVVVVVAWFSSDPAVAAGPPTSVRELPINQWQGIPVSHRAWGNNMVWCPTRKQLLHYDGFTVQAFDAAKGKWVADYPRLEEKGYGFPKWSTGHRGVSLKGRGHMLPSGVPCPAQTINGLTWDSKRNRMLLVTCGLMAAYDPETRKWEQIVCETEWDGRTVKGAPELYGQGVGYDPVNDEVVLFPHWQGARPHDPYIWLDKSRIDIDGRYSGHLGTFLFSFKDNTWRAVRDHLGTPEVRAARAEVLEALKLTSTAFDEARRSIRGKGDSERPHSARSRGIRKSSEIPGRIHKNRDSADRIQAKER